MSNLSDTGSLARHTLFTLIIGTLITLSLLCFHDRVGHGFGRSLQ
uniref:Uncharacterized protein n=1 Tax=Anguilla anguilla TaxID=7936 RepID=A0A0E9PGR2_ANGAN